MMLLSALLMTEVTGCAETPSRIVTYEDKRDQITLTVDPASGNGHNHPYRMSSEQMAKVLQGIRVKDRNAITGFGLFKEDTGTPAFPGTTVAVLAPRLVQALSQASPRDLVTFYVTLSDPRKGPVVTSGGLFVRGEQLYFILANVRTSPTDTSNDFATAMELDNRDAPLEPIGRFRFSAGFSPSQAWIPNSEAKQRTGYESYMDAAKLVVIDLPRLFTEPGPASSGPAAVSPPSLR